MRFDPEHTLYLVDISSFIYRAYYAINRNLKNRKGEPTNAAYGVTTMLLKLINEVNPKYFGIVYDSKEPSFRKKSTMTIKPIAAPRQKISSLNLIKSKLLLKHSMFFQ